MAKENKKSLIIWALVALVIGVVIGLLITNITATGQAERALALDSGKQEANLEEARRDLVIRNLQVSNILANTNYDSQINISSYLKANSGFYANELLVGNEGLRVKNIYPSDNENPSIQMQAGISAINMYADSQDGPKLNIKSHRLNLTGNHISLTNTQGDSAMTIDPTGDITINAPVKMPELTAVSPIVAVYYPGDTIQIENKTIEVMEIWDINGVVKMLLSGASVPSVIEYYTEGDIIFNQYLNANLKIELIDQNSVGIVTLPSGDYYVCINSSNELYKSLYPCN